MDPEEVDPVLIASLDMFAFPRPSVRTRSSQTGFDATLLEIPPHGSLEARLWRDGAPVGDGVQVDVNQSDQTQGSTCGQSVETRNGSAVLSPIALGINLELELESPWVRTRSDEIITEPVNDDDVIPGPVSASESRVLNFDATTS